MFIIGSLFIILFFIRLILPSLVDDVNPLMNCSEEVLDWADAYFVVPKFSGIAISENKEWCNYILNKDKELFLHGVYHSYNEFAVYRSEEYFEDGVGIFRDCFGFVPEKFKPGQLAFCEENSWIKKRIDVELFWNQLFHKVYHCGDTGRFPNWFIRIF